MGGPVLKRGPLANLAFTGPAHLLLAIRHSLRKIQYQPGLIEGCLIGTGLSLEPAYGHHESKICSGGPRIMTNIIGAPGDEVRVVQEVEVVFHAAEDGLAVPRFVPTQSQP
jgi:hypothetical protein